MGRCKSCGKHGLFVMIDLQGRCTECAKKAIADEERQFETHYSNWVARFKNQQKAFDIGNNPISALDLIPALEEKINECDVLKAELHDSRYEKRIVEKLIKSITFRDDFSKRHGMGELPELGIGVYAKPISNEFSPDKILADIEKYLDIFKKKWTRIIKGIQDSAEFQKRIDSIPTVDVAISNIKHNKQTISELDELIKYTNITSKTNFDRLGNFVVIDTETTGLSAIRDTLLEIAAIRFEDWTPVEKFHTLINPNRHIPDNASSINQITDEMVINAPTVSQIIDSLDAFVGKSNIVGHNLPFDLKFLYRNGCCFPTAKRRYYDTCEIAKKTLKKPKMKWDKEYGEYIINDQYDYDVEDYKLTTLCDYYKIRDNTFAHRALSDAFATGCLFQFLAQEKIDY